MKKDIFKIFGGIILLIFMAAFGFSSLASLGTQSNVVLDQTKIDLSLKNYGIQWSPDGHISYITLPGGERRYFIAGNQRAYVIESKANETLEDTLKNNPIIKPIFGPDPNSTYKNNYATISQVLQTDASNPYHLFAFAQFEQQAIKKDKTFDYSNFTSRIGLLESYDGGLNWKDFGPVIRGDDYLNPGTKLTGAGEPSAVIKDGYVYVYYVDWSAQTIAFHPDQIYLARTKILKDGTLGAFEFYTASGFSTREFNLQPVIFPTENDLYASLPSISFNKYLKRYFAIYEVNSGFKIQTSYDLINWANPKLVFSFPKLQSQRSLSDVWYSYPSYLSDTKEDNDQITDKTGNLYFSVGTWPNTAHQPAVVKLSM